MDRKIRRINPIAKALATSRRRTQMVESKKRYNRKDYIGKNEEELYVQLYDDIVQGKSESILDDEIPIEDDDIEEYLK
tara:strand:- start:325 stop:558 length:234 start_codon:yes stop_codon:yes gene_type:complete